MAEVLDNDRHGLPFMVSEWSIHNMGFYYIDNIYDFIRLKFSFYKKCPSFISKYQQSNINLIRNINNSVTQILSQFYRN